MNHHLFRLADFLGRPPGFYLVLTLMLGCTVLVALGWTELVTYALSVTAIIITGLVLIQDTATPELSTRNWPKSF